MSAKPTPGPWAIQGRYGQLKDEIGNGGRAVATVWTRKQLVTEDRVVRQTETRPDPEGEANARLIAAAPELLEALRDAVDLHGHEYSHQDGRPIEIPGSTTGIDWYKQARAAIAKAEAA